MSGKAEKRARKKLRREIQDRQRTVEATQRVYARLMADSYLANPMPASTVGRRYIEKESR